MNEYKFKPSDVSVQEWSNERKGFWSLGILTGIKVIHIPTGIIVCCDDFRSQHRNRDEAFKILNEYLINL